MTISPPPLPALPEIRRVPLKEIKLTAPFYTGANGFHVLREVALFNDYALWVMTYTCNPSFLADVHISRVICHTGQTHHHAKKVRTADNNHAKLYLLVDSKNKPKFGFMGSANFVNPTFNELLYLIPHNQLVKFSSYYNTIWKSLT